MKLHTIAVVLVVAVAAAQGVNGKLTLLRGGTEGERGLSSAGNDYKYGFLVSRIQDNEHWCITALYGVSINKEVTLNRCNFNREPAKQLWRFDEYGRIHSKISPDRCILAGDGKTVNRGSQLKMHNCDTFTYYNKFSHNGGTDRLQLKKDKNYCITNVGSNPDPHENMIVMPCGYRGDYKFHFKVINKYPGQHDDPYKEQYGHHEPPRYSESYEEDHYLDSSSPDHYNDKDHYYSSSPDHYDPEPYYSEEDNKDHYYPSSPDHYDPEPYYSEEDDKDHYYPSSPDRNDDRDKNHYYSSSPDHYDPEPYYSEEDVKDHYYPSSPDHYDPEPYYSEDDDKGHYYPSSPDHYDYEDKDHYYSSSPDHYDPKPYYSEEDDKDHYYPSSPDHYDPEPYYSEEDDKGHYYPSSPDHYDDEDKDHYYSSSPDHYYSEEDDKDHYYPDSPDHYDREPYYSDEGDKGRYPSSPDHFDDEDDSDPSHALKVILEPDTPLGTLMDPFPTTADSWMAFFEEDAAAGGFENALPSAKPQCVYLDFNQRAPYSVDIVNILGIKVGEFGPFVGHFYTDNEKEAILDRLKKDYHLYNVYFTTERPTDGKPYATIRFNANDFPGRDNAITTVVFPKVVQPHATVEVASVVFGFADNPGGGIDYLNLIRDDLIRVQANLYPFLVIIDPTGGLFTKYTGIAVANAAELLEALSHVVINQSANTASHELGHALGLRHHESFGAPGDGLPTTGQPAPGDFYPAYPGPQWADETLLHLMATGASTGLDYPDIAQRDRFFSERSSVKLSLAENCGNFMTEAEAKEFGSDLHGMRIPKFFVENPIEKGQNKGGRYLRIDTVNIAGRINDMWEVDHYRLHLKADHVFTAEVISHQSTLADRVITSLDLLRVYPNGNRQVVASNDYTFEPFDPLILDFVIPATGMYVLAVSVQHNIPVDDDSDGIVDRLVPIIDLNGEEFVTGNYNLLIYTHEDPIGKHHYRDKQKLCPGKKAATGAHRQLRAD